MCATTALAGMELLATYLASTTTPVLVPWDGKVSIALNRTIARTNHAEMEPHVLL